MRKSTYSNLFDLFHKGFVYTCLGSSFLAFTYMAVNYYQYKTVIVPERLEKIKLENEELLREGRETLTP